MNKTKKIEKSIETVMHPPKDLNVLAAISLKAKIAFSLDGENGTIKLHREVIADGFAWEEELLWQALKAIEERQGCDQARESLQAVAARFQDQAKK